MGKIKKTDLQSNTNKKNNIKSNLKKIKNHEVKNGAGHTDMIKKSKQNLNDNIKEHSASPTKNGKKSKIATPATLKKPKTVLAPTPEIKKAKTVLAPTPEVKKPKTIAVATTVEVKNSKTSKPKKPKTVLAPTPEVKKSKTVLAPTPEANTVTKNKRILVSTVEPKKSERILGLAEEAKKRKLKTDQEPPLETKKSKTILPSKKQNVKTKNSQAKQKGSKEKETKEMLVPLFEEAPVYDEDKFNSILSSENVNKNIIALKKMVLNEVKQMKNSIFSDYHYVLNICCFKIPSCPKRVVKLKLKNCLVADKDDIVLIVRDLKRGKKIDHEQTIHHYEDLLREQGIKNIKAIMPFNQLKKEYSSYEMKIKFSNLYEYYLCDSAIVGNVVGFLGNSCSKKMRSTIHAIRMNKPNNLKSEVKKSLDKTSYRQGEKGTMISIPIGHHQMKSEQVSENILYVLEQLKTIYPGGPENIRSIHVRINIKGTSSLPIYMSLGHPPAKTPFVIGQREKKLNKLKNKANEILSKFELSAKGEFHKLNEKKILAKRNLMDENTDLIEIESNEKECNDLKKKSKKAIKNPEKKIENSKKENSSKESKVGNNLKAKSQSKNKNNITSEKEKEESDDHEENDNVDNGNIEDNVEDDDEEDDDNDDDEEDDDDEEIDDE